MNGISSAFWDLLRPQAALAVGALAVLAAGASRRASLQVVKGLALAAVVVALLLLMTVRLQVVCLPLLRSDLLGSGLQAVFLSAAIPLLCLMEPADEVPPALVLGSLIGMGLIAVSGNLLMLFIGLELMSVPAYLLVARSRSPQALEASVKYFFAGGTASAIYLMGMALHFGAAGSLVLAPAPGPAGAAGLALMAAAAFFKLGAVPMHFWLPDVYEASDPELAGFFSTGLKAAAVLFLARLAPMAAPAGALVPALAWFAVLTILFGAVVALRQQNLQRLLAYSSISHAGFMMLAVAAWAKQGLAAPAAGALFFYLAAYLFMSGGAFLWLKAAGVRTRAELLGLAKARPRDAAVLAALLLALAGIPPTAGFAAKFLVFWEAFKAGLYAPLLLAGLGALISLGYYLGLIRDMYFDEAGPEPAKAVGPTPARWFALGCAAASVLLGLTPWLMDWFRPGMFGLRP